MGVLDIWLNLCQECRHEKTCKAPNVQPSAGGGITCGDYSPKVNQRAKVTDAHILALPDREPCHDCAATKGTVANGTPHTLADFQMCVRERQPFLCHADGKGRICAGWLRAVKARASVEDAEIVEVR